MPTDSSSTNILNKIEWSQFLSIQGWRQLYAKLDIGEIVRFLMSGLVATGGNLAAFWAARRVLSFEYSLLAGTVIGFTISFISFKLFAFKSRQWKDAPGEVARFLVVYAISFVIYLIVSINARAVLTGNHFPAALIDLTAVLCGGGCMAVSSYTGHRLFTYRRTARLA